MMRTVSFRSKCKIAQAGTLMNHWCHRYIASGVLSVTRGAFESDGCKIENSRCVARGRLAADVSYSGTKSMLHEVMQGLSASRLSWECNQTADAAEYVLKCWFVEGREKKNTTYCRRPWYSQRWWSSSASDPRQSPSCRRASKTWSETASTAPYIMSMFQSK